MRSQNSIFKLLPIAALGLSLSLTTGCSDSDDDSGSGYIQLYNAMPSASSITLNIDDSALGSYVYNDASTQYEVDRDTYELEFTYATSSTSDQTIADFEHDISGDKVSLFVVTGDTDNSEVLKLDYEYEDPDTDDAQFTFRVLNLAQSHSDLDLYIADEGGSFTNATLLSSTNLYSLSDSFYFDTDTYKFFITETNSQDILYESDDIQFAYTNQQIIAINPNLGAGQSELQLDIITSSGGVTEYANTGSNSQVRFYNALIEHELLPEYQGYVDIYIDGLDDEAEVQELAKNQYSAFFNVDYGDYPLDITNSNTEKLTNTQLVSALPNASVTKFFYITEEEEEDEDGNLDVEIFFNSIELEASDNASNYLHDFQVLNFSNEYSTIKLYFVESNETKSTTSNLLTGTFSIASSISLYNDNYDIYVTAIEGSSEVLLASTTLTLNETSSNYYLIVEDEDSEDFEVTIFPQK